MPDASFERLTDGINAVGVVPAATGMPAALSVATGSAAPVATLSAVTANTTGTSVDFGSAQANFSVVAVAGSAPTAGTLTLELSHDNVTFVSSTATASITAAGNYGIFSTGRAARYARASLTGLTGTITLTATIMAD